MSSSSPKPQSVRGLYTPPAEEWVFLPPTVQAPAAAPSIPPPPAHLPTPFTPEDDDMVDLGLPGPVQLFGTQFFLTALGMPFEVGKTLLQVEYRPRRRFESLQAPTEPSQEEGREWGAEDDTLSNAEEADIYFSDRLEAPTNTFVPPPPPKADASGYLSDPSPSWQLKDDPEVSRSNGVWGMIRRIRATPSEGLPALWKGQVVTTVHDVIASVLQPRVHALLYALMPSTGVPLPLDFPLTALPHPGLPFALSVGSHALTQFVLSPLELVRTRLIVQPGSLPSTPSSLTLLRRAIDNEGGLAGLYLAPNVFFPAVLELTLRPLLTMSIPLVLERYFGLSADLSPITYALADLGLNVASLLILTPIETVRRRLQLQTVDGERPVRSVVRLRDRPYVGMVEAMWRIVTEETAAPRKRKMSEKDEGGLFQGINQLYRGFGMAVTAHLTVFGLGLVSAGLGGRGLDSGWKEI